MNLRCDCCGRFTDKNEELELIGVKGPGAFIRACNKCIKSIYTEEKV